MADPGPPDDPSPCNGTSTAAAPDDDAGLRETRHLLGNPRNAERLLRAIRQFDDEVGTEPRHPDLEAGDGPERR